MSPLPANAFSLGVNYPWLRYGQDFGTTDQGYSGVGLSDSTQCIAQDFARIRDCGATVVRWFLFADGRGGFAAEKGIPRSPDRFLLADVAAVLALAEKFRLKLCFSLIDYLWLQNNLANTVASPRASVLQFAAGREAFLENVLIPLFREFRAHPALFAWEIANEPECAIREFHPAPAATLHIADFRAFAREVAGAVREFGEVPVTLGSARLLWLRAWSEIGLDFYQAHYYPSAETASGDLAAQLASLSRLDKPLWLGELPARDPSSPSYSVLRALDACRDAHLAGAAVWRWTAPQPVDTDLAIGCIEPTTLQAWSMAEPAQGQHA